MVVQQTRASLHCIFPCVERSVRIIDFAISFFVKLVSGQVNGSSKCTCTVRGCTYTTLNLNTAQRGSKIRKVNKIRALAFCIIVWNAVHSYINPAVIASSNAYAGITNPVSSIGAYNCRGGLIKKGGQVGAEVQTFNCFLINILFGKRCISACPYRPKFERL